MATFVPVWSLADNSMTPVQAMSNQTLASGVLYPAAISGMLAYGQDDSLGFGEFVFAQVSAAAGVAAGDVCEITPSTITIGNSVVAMLSVQKWQGTTLTGKSLCVALVASAQFQFAWFQVQGMALCNSNGAVAAGDKAFFQAAGVVSSSVVASKQVVNAQAIVANSATFGQTVSGVASTISATQAVYFLNFPFAQGAIT